MKDVKKEIYPNKLVLVPDEITSSACPFLDLQLTIKDNIISFSIHNKRDASNSPIINFPRLTGNITIKSSIGVF